MLRLPINGIYNGGKSRMVHLERIKQRTKVMDSPKLISIIIPVYNIEKLLSRCLESVVKQNIPTDVYEIIIVDDESPDRSIDIANRYAYLYANFKILRQKNKGLSGARNSGLNMAVGQYVWFVDGDDHIAENCLNKILLQLQETPCDILAFDFLHIKSNGEKKVDTQKIEGDKNWMIGIDYMRLNGAGQAWRNIYSRKFLTANNLYFTQGMLHEDGEFNIRAKALAARVGYLAETLYYYYTTREGSIMNSFKYKNVEDLISYSEKALEFVAANNIKYDDQRVIFNVAADTVFMSLSISKFLTLNDEALFLRLLQTERKKWFKVLWHSYLPLKKKLFGLALYLYPRTSKIYNF